MKKAILLLGILMTTNSFAQRGGEVGSAEAGKKLKEVSQFINDLDIQFHQGNLDQRLAMKPGRDRAYSVYTEVRGSDLSGKAYVSTSACEVHIDRHALSVISELDGNRLYEVNQWNSCVRREALIERLAQLEKTFTDAEFSTDSNSVYRKTLKEMDAILEALKANSSLR